MMKKFSLFLLFAGSLAFMVGCDDDDTPLTDAQKVENLISAAQTAVEAKVTSSATATGATDITVFDDWTFADKAGYVNGAAEAVPAEITTKAPVVNVTADITTNTTWTSGNVYVLKKRVKVKNNATLTIEAGTVIKGDASLTRENAAVLMVTTEGKINAVGTAAKPIIFTSTEDKIEPGQIQSPNLKVTDKSKWGGLVILGKAKSSFKADATQTQIEGVPATDTDGLHGGSDNTHSSGTLKYISIRHGGVEIEDGKEINGLTLGSVGSGTVIENVEVYANLDDGVEFFGGAVSAKNIIVVNQGDDAIDIDQSYTGTVDNALVVLGIDKSDEGLEIDGREGSALGSFTVKNVTVKLEGAKVGFAADLKSKAQGSLTNVVFEGFDATTGRLRIQLSYDETTFAETEDAAKNVIDGTLTISNCKFDAIKIED